MDVAPLFVGTFRLATLLILGAFVVTVIASWVLQRAGAPTAADRTSLASQVVLRLGLSGIFAVLAVQAVEAGGPVLFALAVLFALLALWEIGIACAFIYGITRYSPEASDLESRSGRTVRTEDGEMEANPGAAASERPRCPSNYHWDESVRGCVPDRDGPDRP